MTTLKQYLMGREVKFPITEEQELNALDLLDKVEKLFNEIGILNPVLTSGYRPASINASVGGAKMSAHTTCEAGDWENIGHRISDKISVSLLTKYGLYMEDPRYAKNWIHLQVRPTKSGSRIFIP